MADLMSTLNSGAGLTFDLSPFSVIVLILVAVPLCNYLFSLRYSSSEKFWRAQSWVGLRPGWFAKPRAQLNTIRNAGFILEQGYHQYSVKGQTFTYAQPGYQYCILPPSTIHGLLATPDTHVNSDVIHNEQIASRQFMGDRLTDNKFHFNVVRRQLTRKLPLLTTDVSEELALGFEQHWGTDQKNWRSVKVMPTCMRIVSQAANRIFAGKELCRNDGFLEHSKLFAQSVFKSAAWINMMPSWLRPVVATLVAKTSVRKHRTICLRYSVPVVQRRLDALKSRSEDPQQSSNGPNDALQWLIEEALNQNDPAELDAEVVSRRLLALNMVAIHTTSMIITNTILELFNSPHAAEFIGGLHEECQHVLQEHGGSWSKDAVNQLYRIDSCIREAMRRDSLGKLGLHRMVTAPEGVTLSGDIHIPAGIRVSVATHAIHNDFNIYSDPYTFDAFRFSAPREELVRQTQAASSAVLYATTDTASTDSISVSLDVQQQQQLQKQKQKQTLLNIKNQSLITSSDKFLAFGHGRHACPGRFFAAQEMKLMLAHILMNYDVRTTTPDRPAQVEIGDVSMPPEDATIQIRRRAA